MKIPQATTSKSNSSQRGWNGGQTFLMMVFLVAILALGTAAVYALVTLAVNNSRETITQERLDRWKAAITLYKQHTGSYPASLADLQVAVSSCSTNAAGELSGYCGPYYVSEFHPDSELLNDAWGEPLEYSVARKRVRSCGPNHYCPDNDDMRVTFP